MKKLFSKLTPYEQHSIKTNVIPYFYYDLQNSHTLWEVIKRLYVEMAKCTQTEQEIKLSDIYKYLKQLKIKNITKTYKILHTPVKTGYTSISWNQQLQAYLSEKAITNLKQSKTILDFLLKIMPDMVKITASFTQN